MAGKAHLFDNETPHTMTDEDEWNLNICQLVKKVKQRF
jgi:hypothetical protein